MDNITPLVPGTKKSSCVITLDPFQYAFYQQSCIEIQNPDGDLLEFIGKPIQQERAATISRVRLGGFDVSNARNV